MIEMLAPYALMLIVAAVPTGIWRAGAVVLSRSISSQSLVFEWVRFVATALLAGVVAKLLANPSGALAL
ncbi:MAG: AzlD domain-containing protein, partial [Rhizobiales bacterium]|nr:AzlD domain-containing protein [Hyphomicrobiales bacterium]